MTEGNLLFAIRLFIVINLFIKKNEKCKIWLTNKFRDHSRFKIQNSEVFYIFYVCNLCILLCAINILKYDDLLISSQI